MKRGVPPVVKPGDLLIKINAASVNPIDTAIISKYGLGFYVLKSVLGEWLSFYRVLF